MVGAERPVDGSDHRTITLLSGVAYSGVAYSGDEAAMVTSLSPSRLPLVERHVEYAEVVLAKAPSDGEAVKFFEDQMANPDSKLARGVGDRENVWMPVSWVTYDDGFSEEPGEGQAEMWLMKMMDKAFLPGMIISPDARAEDRARWVQACVADPERWVAECDDGTIYTYNVKTLTFETVDGRMVTITPDMGPDDLLAEFTRELCSECVETGHIDETTPLGVCLVDDEEAGLGEWLCEQHYETIIETAAKETSLTAPSVELG